MIEEANSLKKVVNAYYLVERINQQENLPVEAALVIPIQKPKKTKKHQDSIALNSDSEK